MVKERVHFMISKVRILVCATGSALKCCPRGQAVLQLLHRRICQNVPAPAM